MASTLVNLAGFTPGIAADEAGMNVESVTITANSKKIEVPGKNGNTRGTWYHDKKKTFEVSGETTGEIAATVGGPLVVGNDMPLGGITTGSIICEEVSITKGREALQKVSIKAVQCEEQIIPGGGE